MGSLRKNIGKSSQVAMVETSLGRNMFMFVHNSSCPIFRDAELLLESGSAKINWGSSALCHQTLSCVTSGLLFSYFTVALPISKDYMYSVKI